MSFLVVEIVQQPKERVTFLEEKVSTAIARSKKENLSKVSSLIFAFLFSSKLN